MLVCVPTTPAQCFHMIRRQLRMTTRKPLIVMSPKSLLRHKLAVSSLDELANGEFQHLIPDASANPKKVKRVVLCSGKVYYDLLDAREKKGVNDVYILRLEQCYPWPIKSLSTELARFPNAELVWCQEEPKNMGAWSFVEPYIEWVLSQAGVSAKRARYVGRPAAASTAVGQMSKHLAQLRAFLDDAFAA